MPRKVIGKVVEHILADNAMSVQQEFAVIALGNREFCDTLIGQWITVIADFNIFCFHWLYVYNATYYGKNHNKGKSTNHNIYIYQAITCRGIL
ncbi:hypothetical protein SAMN04487825_11266 [Prevotella sp. kh1p2]|nr:hypothetical protein SAMN04487825_11266 [Prevotella sp. kh1p2]SNU11763.1 hypothetical protein SAMN06298210_11378 [Prevotellaceae bacterium KH2P17]